MTDEKANQNTDETHTSLMERQDAAVSAIRDLANHLPYCPPEAIPVRLASIMDMLIHHFSESIARADAPYAASIVRKIGLRRKNDPEFDAAMREELAKES